MANAFLNAQVYANTMLLLLKNQLVMGRLVDGKFENKVTDENGLRIYVKKPPRFIANSGATLAAQDVVTGSTSIAVDQYKNVHISIGDLEMVQSYNDLVKSETMKSAASTLAHDVDLYLHQQLRGFFSHVGTLGTALSTAAHFMAPHTRLMDQSVPNTDLRGVVSFADAAAFRATLTGGNIQGTNKTALEKVKIPVVSEIDWYATQNLRTLTTGTRADAAVNGAAQNVNYVDVKDQDYQNLIIDSAGVAGSTIAAGEIFTIAGVYAVNPRSKETLSHLQQFVVTEATTTAGAGEDATVRIFPYIITSGAYQTVSAAPADNAVVTWLGTASTAYSTKAVWHKQAIQLVSARLVTPMSDTSSFATDPETGISIRYWRGSDISTGAHIHRWDMIYGAKCIDPWLGVRVSGS